MKVIFFTRYTRKGASSRLRTFQYLEFLTSQGITWTVSPFFGEEYLEELYHLKRHNKWLAMKAFMGRMFALLTVHRYDKVVIEKELFPFFPALFERLLSLTKVRYIVDYDDAIFHNYDLHPNPVVRFLLRNKINHVMRLSAVVVTGNEYIHRKAIDANAKNIVLIPTVIDVAKYSSREYSISPVFTIGWIGSPITFKYLRPLKAMFEELAIQHKIRITLIGSEQALGLVGAEEVVKPWSEEQEVQEIQLFDVGIMPLEDNYWERGKCGYKLIQYMGCSVPVIGTPIGVNDRIIQDGVNGFKATSIEDWRTKLDYMIRNPMTRSQMGQNGRFFVEQHFSLKVFQQAWLSILAQT